MSKYFSCLLLPLALAVIAGMYLFAFVPFKPAVYCILALLICGGVLRQKQKRAFSKYMPGIEEYTEKINLLNNRIIELKKVMETYPEKAEKVFSLSKIVDEFTSLERADSIQTFLIDNLARFLPQAENLLFFAVNQKKGTLALTYSIRKKGKVIKEKKGEPIDWWVLRHNQSLNVEDFGEDFRFDQTKSEAFINRGVNSFMVSPVSLGDKVVGVVRMESPDKKGFSLDDLRISRVACDVAAAFLDRADLFERIREMAIKDALTGTFLRDIFLERLKEEMTRARISDTSIALGILDIDDFKKINDNYGHAVGDLVIKKVAGVLEKLIGDSGNMVARFGGEEFVFFMLRTSYSAIKSKAEKMVEDIASAKVTFRRKDVPFTVSMGVAIFPEQGNDPVTLIQTADSLLYKAKSEGKNRVCFNL